VAALAREQVPLFPAGIAATPKTRPALKWFPPAVPSQRSLILVVWCQDRLRSNCQDNERMPVLLTREEEFEAWLKGSPDEAFALTREHPARH
jgi:putative SOS response-associated peptidase YedK